MHAPVRCILGSLNSTSTPASRAHLDAIPVFSCLNPAERGILLPHCRIRVFRKGETVFTEGDRTTELSFVVFGSVKVLKSAHDRSVVIRLLGPGEPIGIVASMQSIPYPASAVAVEPSTVLQIPERDFFGIIDRHPEIARQLLRLFMVRQAELAQRLQENDPDPPRAVVDGREGRDGAWLDAESLKETLGAREGKPRRPEFAARQLLPEMMSDRVTPCLLAIIDRRGPEVLKEQSPRRPV